LISLLNNRSRFKTFFSKSKMFFFSLVAYLPFSKIWLSGKQKKEFMIYRNGKSKLSKDFDVIKIVRLLRALKVIYQAKIHKGLNAIVHFQRQNVLESQTESEILSDDQAVFENLHSKNSIHKALALGLFSRRLKGFD
jgi:hypothetical protein